MARDGEIAEIGGGTEGEVGEGEVAGRRVGHSHVGRRGRRRR